MRLTLLTISAALIANLAEAQTIKVAAAPSVRIGSSDDAKVMLNAVAGATRLPNGQIVVGNRGDYALLVFDAQGKFLRQAARKGKGPGEVEYLLYVKRCGNALYLGDVEAQRVQEFSFDFAVKRAFRFADQTYRLDCNSAGRFVHMGWEPSKSMRGGVYRAKTRFWITGADTTRGITFDSLPGSERFGVTGENGRMLGSGPLVLGRETRVTIGPQSVFVSTADSMTLLVYGLDGEAKPSWRAPYQPTPTTDADIDEEIERQVASHGEDARKRMEKELRAMPRPKNLPATRDILVDETGLVWVQSYPSAKQPRVKWTVFNPSGTVAARVSLPANLEVFEIGKDYVLGQLPDDDGVPEIQLYTISRS